MATRRSGLWLKKLDDCQLTCPHEWKHPLS